MKKGLLPIFFAAVMIFMLAACNTNEGAMDREDTDFNQVSYGPGHQDNQGNQQGGGGMETGQNRFDVNIPNGGMTSDGQDGDEGNQRSTSPNETDQQGNQDHLGSNKQRIDQVNGAFQEQVIKLTNQARKENGLSALKNDSEVANVAQKKSQDMSENSYFSHTSPTYGSPFDMLKEFGVDYSTAAENIAAGQQTPDEVVRKWLDSPGHRKNIMNKNITHIGVGYTEDGQYWTQMFIGKK